MGPHQFHPESVKALVEDKDGGFGPAAMTKILRFDRMGSGHFAFGFSAQQAIWFYLADATARFWIGTSAAACCI